MNDARMILKRAIRKRRTFFIKTGLNHCRETFSVLRIFLCICRFETKVVFYWDQPFKSQLVWVDTVDVSQ